MRAQQQIQILVNQGSDVLDFSFDERGSLHFRFDRQEIGHFGFSSGLDVDCCNERQQVLLAEFFLLLVGICLVFYTPLFLPLKRLCSFFHEFGQALAVWLVCGKVRMIDLQGKHGGETIFEGVGKTGLCVVHPAGYFASAAWAIALIVASGGEGLMSQLLAFVTAGVIFLCFINETLLNKNKACEVLPLFCLFNIALLVGLGVWCIVGTYSLRYRILESYLVFLGVSNAVFFLLDIIEDAILKPFEKSDVARFARSTRCCHPILLALIGIVLFLASLAVALIFALVLRRTTNSVNYSDQPSYWQWVVYGLSAACAILAVAYRSRLIYQCCCVKHERSGRSVVA